MLAIGATLAAGSVCAANIVWTNLAGGNWSNPTNWSPNQMPGSSSTAIITKEGTYTVMVDTNSKVSGLVVGAVSGATTQNFIWGVSVAGDWVTGNVDYSNDTNGITSGTLFPYNKSLPIYQCPDLTPAGGELYVRSVSVMERMGGAHGRPVCGRSLRQRQWRHWRYEWDVPEI